MKTNKEMKSVAEDEGLRNMLDSEDSDEEEKSNQSDAKEDEDKTKKESEPGTFFHHSSILR